MMASIESRGQTGPLLACDPVSNKTRLRRSAGVTLSVIGLAAVVGCGIATWVLGLPVTVLLVAVGVMTVLFAFALLGLAQHPHPRFGPANGVTASRAAMTAFIAGAVLFAPGFDTGGALDWTIVGLLALMLALDGVDGALARHYGEESAFGARFDMETDALLILILSLAVLIADKAGVFVLAIGAMRYGFILCQMVLPAWRRDLPPSFRRKLVCVLQVGGLCVLLLPVLQPPYTDVLALALLVALAYSFAADILWLQTRSESARARAEEPISQISPGKDPARQSAP